MATVGDLFINFKVRKDGLDSAGQSLGKFVDKSKRQLNDLNQGFGALGNLLASIGIPTTAISSAMEFVGVLTKGIPSIVKGFTSMSGAAAAFKAILSGIGGPIVLVVAAIASIGAAFYKAMVDDAASAAAAFEKTLDGVKQRAEAATKAVSEIAQALGKSRESISSIGGKIAVQQAIVLAPVGQEEAAAKQAERLYEQLAASNAIIAAEQQRDELQKRYSAAAADLVRTQEAYSDALEDGDEQRIDRVRQILELKQQEVKTLEDASTKARLNADATADQLILLRQSFDLEDKIAAKKVEQEAIEQRRLQADAAMTAFMAEELAIEDELLRLREGEEALQERIYERRLENAGLEQDMIDYLVQQREEVARLTKETKERLAIENDLKDMKQRRADLEEKIAQTATDASAKALEDDIKRQQFTESLDTAIGEFKIAGITDAVDIQKRIADETKLQTAELRKLNEKIGNQEALLQ